MIQEHVVDLLHNGEGVEGVHGHTHVEVCPVNDDSNHQEDKEAVDLDHHHLEYVGLGDIILSAVRGKRDLNLIYIYMEEGKQNRISLLNFIQHST